MKCRVVSIFSGTRLFDARMHYHSRCFRTMVMKDHEDEIVGVQLINAIDHQTSPDHRVFAGGPGLAEFISTSRRRPLP